jgi:hypothetical protein
MVATFIYTRYIFFNISGWPPKNVCVFGATLFDLLIVEFTMVGSV